MPPRVYRPAELQKALGVADTMVRRYSRALEDATGYQITREGRSRVFTEQEYQAIVEARRLVLQSGGMLPVEVAVRKALGQDVEVLAPEAGVPMASAEVPILFRSREELLALMREAVRLEVGERHFLETRVDELEGEVSRLKALPAPTGIDTLGPDLLEELRALRAEVAELRSRDSSGAEVAEAIREAVAELEPTPTPRQPPSLLDRAEGFLSSLLRRR